MYLSRRDLTTGRPLTRGVSAMQLLGRVWTLVISAILAAWPVLADDGESAGSLRIGWASADLTPERAISVAGMSSARLSRGVADPITATVLVVEAGRKGEPADMVVLVSCDLLYIVNPLRDHVRELVHDVSCQEHLTK